MKKDRPNPLMPLLALVLVLFPAFSLARPQAAAAASTQAYTQLRLLVEALYEIDAKYVTEKKDRDLIYGAIRGMVASLDPNSSFLSPTEYQEALRGPYQPEADAGLELSVKDNLLTVIAPVEGGPAWRSGIKADDHILKINNQSVRNLTALEAAKKFQGPSGTKVKVQIIRAGFAKPMDLELTLEKNTLESVVSHLLEDGIYYIRVRIPRERAVQELQQALRTIQANPAKRGIILDLRNTASGHLEEARRLASTFVGNDLIYSVKGRQGERRQSFNGSRDIQVLKERVPVVILVDQGTARAAEVIAGALQAQYGALLLGYKTFGDCAVTKVFPLKDGSALIVSVGYCYTPKDHLIQSQGLEPDIPGPKKEAEDQAGRGSSLKPEKHKKLPDLDEVRQDPLVRQALAKLKNWGGKNSFSRAPQNRFERKKQAAGSLSVQDEIS
jgi:carboxyl-terminal processing protease